MASEREFRIVRCNLAPGHAHASRRVEKPKSASDLRGRERGSRELPPPRGASPSRQSLCRFETENRTPLWDGPFLRAPFAAQVLAQALNTGRADALSAQAVYRRPPRFARPLLFETRI